MRYRNAKLDKSLALIVRRSSELAASSFKRNRLIVRAVDEALEFIPVLQISDEKLDGPCLEENADNPIGTK